MAQQQIELEISFQKLLQQNEKLINELKKTQKEGESLGDSLKDGLGKGESESKKFAKSLVDVDKALNVVKNTSDDLGDELRQLKILQDELTKSALKYDGKNLEKVESNLRKVKARIKDVKDEQQKLANANNDSDKGASRLVGTFKRFLALGIATKVAEIISQFKAFANENNKLISSVAKLNAVGDDNINAVTAQIQGLVKASESLDIVPADFQEISEAANAISKQLGISFDASLNIIQQGLSEGLNSSGEFLDNLKEYAPVFKEIGGTADDALDVARLQKFFGTFSDSGFATIEEGLLRLRELPDATKDALKSIGLSADTIQKEIASGQKSVFDVLKEVSSELSNFESDSKVVGKAIADIFGPAGEKAGFDFITSLKDVDLALGDSSEKAKQAKADYLALTEANAEVSESINRITAEFEPYLRQIDLLIAKIKVFALASTSDNRRGIFSFFRGNEAEEVQSQIDVLNDIQFQGAKEAQDAFLEDIKETTDAEKKFFEGRKKAKELESKALLESQKKEIDAKKKALEKAENERKKLAQEIEKSRLEEANRLFDLEQSFNSELVALQKEQQALEISNLEEGSVQRINLTSDLLLAEIQERENALKRKQALIILEKETTKAEIEALTNAEVEARLQAIETTVELEKDAAASFALLRNAIQEQRLEKIQNFYDEQLAIIDKGIADIESETDSENESLANATEKKLQLLEEQNELEVARLKASQGFYGASGEVTDKGQKEILKLQLDFLQKQLDFYQALSDTEIEALESQGENVGKAILGIQSEINKAQSQLQGGGEDGEGNDIFDLLGLNISDEKKEALLDLYRAVSQEIGNIIAGAFENAINRQNELIDTFDENISDLESQLEREKDLQDIQSANSVETLEKDLEAQKSLRNDAIKEREKLQKKQAAIDKAEQKISLALTIANIFKSLSGLGPVGIALGATAVTGFLVLLEQFIGRAQSLKKGTDYFKGDGSSNHEGKGGLVFAHEGEAFIQSEKNEKYHTIVKGIRRDNKSMILQGVSESLGIKGLEKLQNTKALQATTALNLQDINLEKQVQMYIDSSNQADLLKGIKTAVDGTTEAIKQKPTIYRKKDSTVFWQNGNVKEILD